MNALLFILREYFKKNFLKKHYGLVSIWTIYEKIFMIFNI